MICNKQFLRRVSNLLILFPILYIFFVVVVPIFFFGGRGQGGVVFCLFFIYKNIIFSPTAHKADLAPDKKDVLDDS